MQKPEPSTFNVGDIAKIKDQQFGTFRVAEIKEDGTLVKNSNQEVDPSTCTLHMTELDHLRKQNKEANIIIHNLIVAEQAAWIEWAHGDGAEKAMEWIQNGLMGPGHIPDEDAEHGKEPQKWFDTNIKAYDFT